MVHAKNYETVSTFVKVMQKKTVASFFPDTVYITVAGHFPVFLRTGKPSAKCVYLFLERCVTGDVAERMPCQ